MASRLVGIRPEGYPLLYQYITVKLCGPLLDISAVQESSRTSTARISSSPRITDERDQELA